MYSGPVKVLIYLPGGFIALFILAFAAFLVTGWLREVRVKHRLRRITDHLHNQTDD